MELRIASFVLVVVLLISPPAFSQMDWSRADEEGPMPVAVSFFAPFFLPKVLQDVYQLREFLISPEFAAKRDGKGDRAAVDVLFLEARRLSWNNTYEALLVTFLTCIEHRRVPFKVPLLGIVLPLPLTWEFEDEFEERVRSLPSRLYADSPAGGGGDRDKLQHFFGSALVTVLTESSSAAEGIGNFIEVGENRHVLGEQIDLRDLRSNRQGQAFGVALQNDPGILPSVFFKDDPIITLRAGELHHTGTGNR